MSYIAKERKKTTLNADNIGVFFSVLYTSSLVVFNYDEELNIISRVLFLFVLIFAVLKLSKIKIMIILIILY